MNRTHQKFESTARIKFSIAIDQALYYPESKLRTTPRTYQQGDGVKVGILELTGTYRDSNSIDASCFEFVYIVLGKPRRPEKGYRQSKARMEKGMDESTNEQQTPGLQYSDMP